MFYQQDNFLGFVADGFPDLWTKNPDSLNASVFDDCNGEYGPTPDFPDSIYHYHTIAVLNIGAIAGTYLIGDTKIIFLFCFSIGLKNQDRC